MKELCIFAGCVYFRITVFPFNVFSFFPTKIIYIYIQYGNATWFLGSIFTSDGLEKKTLNFTCIQIRENVALIVIIFIMNFVSI